MGPDTPSFDSFFVKTMNTSTLMASAPLTPPPHDAPPTTIKMEDLQAPLDIPSPAYSSFPSCSDPLSTPTSASESKPVKKRKSWGQVLPEPKTQLPPRKRAKTEDEKEQRRIERVKRNRLAAHNSRERKRQEYDTLQAEKDHMEAQLSSFRSQVVTLQAELQAWRSKYPSESPEPTASMFDLAASAVASAGSAADTVCPAQTSTSFPSPVSMDMDSPRDSSYQPETPASLFASADLDSTQYPAVSVDFDGGLAGGLALAGGDLDLSYALPPHAPLAEKHAVLDDTLFDFDQFPESNLAATAEPLVGLADPSGEFFGSAWSDHGPASMSGSFPDELDAQLSGLQSASGATYVSDEALAAES